MVFSAKLQSYIVYTNFKHLMSGVVVLKGHTYYLNKPAALSMYGLLLSPGIKGLTGSHKCL